MPLKMLADARAGRRRRFIWPRRMAARRRKLLAGARAIAVTAGPRPRGDSGKGVRRRAGKFRDGLQHRRGVSHPEFGRRTGLSGAGGNGDAVVCARHEAGPVRRLQLFALRHVPRLAGPARRGGKILRAPPRRSTPTAISPSPTSAGITSRQATTLPRASGWSARCGWNRERTSSPAPILIWRTKGLPEPRPARSLFHKKSG